MKNKFKSIVAAVLVAMMVFSGGIITPVDWNPLVTTAEAASVKISKTKMTLGVGESSTLKVTGTSKKAKWSSSKKSVATVSSSGKVTAKKAGTATIKAKVGSKTYSCKV